MRIIGNDPSKTRQTQRVASGALTDGTAVVVNSDGTVSAVVDNSRDQGVGSEVVFESATSTYIAAAYDSDLQKVVVAYRDGGNSNYGTAVVGTVSGTSISFGTPVLFASSNSFNISSDYDANAQKIVIAYSDVDNSEYGTAVVGTVSGTSISFGTPVVFASTDVSYTTTTYDASAQKTVISYQGPSNYGTAVVGTVSGTSISFGTSATFESAETKYIASTYDANAQKIVIAYSDADDLDYGKAVVGTVSGTSISFGSPVTFESAVAQFIDIAYVSDAQKVVVAYRDGGNSNYGTARVGTVSGTSISFGAVEVFSNGTNTYANLSYDSNVQKVVVAYRDGGNSNYGTIKVGTISGTSIDFGTAGAAGFIFNAGTTNYISSVYEPNSQRVAIAYTDGGNSNYGTGIVYQNAFQSLNLTAENYIGISRSGAADGAGAIVDTQGAVADNLTGLTAGQSYYVQTDGTLSTTADDPSVFAGTAVSATKLIVKG